MRITAFSRRSRKPRRLHVRTALSVEQLEARVLLAGNTTDSELVPVDDVYTIGPGNELHVPPTVGVLRNDRVAPTVSAELVEAAQHGELTLASDGSFHYAADPTFPGIDRFRYRISGSTAAANVATVTVGSAEALDDVVHFRVEIVDLEGNAAATASVGELLELRVFAAAPENESGRGILITFFDIEATGPLTPQFENQVFNGDGFHALGPRGQGTGLDDVATLWTQPHTPAAGEHLLARALFTAEQPGSMSLAVDLTQDVVDTDEIPTQPHLLMPVVLGDPATSPPGLVYVSTGQINTGDSASIEFLATENNRPEAGHDVYRVPQRGTLHVDAASGVLANDRDADGQTLMATLVQGPRHGDVTLQPDGSFTYTQLTSPTLGRADDFYYVVSDGESMRLATVRILIEEEVPPLPVDWHNEQLPADVNGDGLVTATDELLVRNDLELNGPRVLPAPTDGNQPPPFLDTNGDGWLTVDDVETVRSELGELVAIHLTVTDLAGNPLEQTAVGEPFLLRGEVEDLRAVPEGVFVAYTDVVYDAGLANITGEIRFGDDFPGFRSGDTTQAGLLDEVGAGRSVQTSVDAQAVAVVFEVPFVATAAGQVTFTSDPADGVINEVAILGRNQAVPVSQIVYGETSLVIGEVSGDAPVARPDRYQVKEDGLLVAEVATGVLVNDDDPNGDPIEAVLVSAPRHGTVSLQANGAFRYEPAADFAGEDRFLYRATDGTFSSPSTAVTIEVVGSDDAPLAKADVFVATRGERLVVAARDGVLSNDIEPDGQPLVAVLGSGPLHGSLALAEDGSFSYQPDEGFSGDDEFTYRASDGSLESELVTVRIRVNDVEDALVMIYLEAVDSSGARINEIAVGESFQLQAFVQDVRERPLGVFAAYLDVEYDPSRVKLDGDLVFSDAYSNGVSGDTTLLGLLDEVGGFSGSTMPVGGGIFPLFSATFTATTAGEALFAGNPADTTPAHDVLAFGLNSPIPDDQIDIGDVSIINIPGSQIQFAATSLRVTAARIAHDDHFDIRSGKTGVQLDVLSNDLAGVEVSDTGATSHGGSVSITEDQQRIVYEPPAGDFIGVETFQYSSRDVNGNTDQATVTVTVVSRFQNPENKFDTDGDGHVVPLDVLFGVNRLNERGAKRLTDDDVVIAGSTRFLDVNGDGFHSPGDVLATINQLNSATTAPEGGGEGEAKRTAAQAVEPIRPSASQVVAPANAIIPRLVDRTSPTETQAASRLGNHRLPTLESMERDPAPLDGELEALLDALAHDLVRLSALEGALL